MIPLLRRLVYAILWDEAAGKRAMAGGLFLIGSFLETSTIPGTATVVRLEDILGSGLSSTLSSFSPMLKAAGIYLGAGGKLPSGKPANSA
jgi:hypothetical protein